MKVSKVLTCACRQGPWPGRHDRDEHGEPGRVVDRRVVAEGGRGPLEHHRHQLAREDDVLGGLRDGGVVLHELHGLERGRSARCGPRSPPGSSGRSALRSSWAWRDLEHWTIARPGPERYRRRVDASGPYGSGGAHGDHGRRGGRRVLDPRRRARASRAARGAGGHRDRRRARHRPRDLRGAGPRGRAGVGLRRAGGRARATRAAVEAVAPGRGRPRWWTCATRPGRPRSWRGWRASGRVDILVNTAGGVSGR